MRALVVLYDAGCEFCRGARDWLDAQPKRIPVAFLPAGSAEARAIYPDVDHARTLGELTAIDDRGNIFRDEKAWIVSLWTTRNHHAMANRLSSARLLPVARATTAWLGRNRRKLGPAARWFAP
jgi:predicted DCC family thiol-disulfide oxidoreductase YuxK